MKKTSLIIMAAFALAACGPAGNDAQQGGPTADPVGENPQGCLRFFVGGKAPLLQDVKFKPKTRVICRRASVLKHSGIARQPLWVAEALTRDQIKLAFGVQRIDKFHPEGTLPKDERAELSDYAGSGYDRGHMAPEADMPSYDASEENYSLAGMSPQAPKLNRGSWSKLEGAVRRQTVGGPVYVVTGPLFEGARLATTHTDHRLLVPTAFFKAVYAQDRGATVFVAENDNDPRWTTMTIDQFVAVHGLDPFPALDPRFRGINGALDGSLNRIKAVAQSTGAAANSPPSGGGASGPVCHPVGPANIRNPTTGQPITLEQYRRWFGHDPSPEEYCR